MFNQVLEHFFFLDNSVTQALTQINTLMNCSMKILLSIITQYEAVCRDLWFSLILNVDKNVTFSRQQQYFSQRNVFY